MNKRQLQLISKAINNNKFDDIYRKYNPGRYKKGYCPYQYIRIHLLFSFKGFKSFNKLHKNLKEEKELRKFCCLNTKSIPSPGRMSEFRRFSNLNFFEEVNKELLESLKKMNVFDEDIVVIIPDSTDQQANCKPFGKRICNCETKKCKCQKEYTATGATMGGRTKKSGQTQTFIGYKKHTIWTWLPKFSKLIPLISTTKTATYSDHKAYLENINFVSDVFKEKEVLSVADMGYIDSETKNISRVKYNIPLITAMKKNMIIDDKLFDHEGTPTCPEGYKLLHYEFDWKIHTHFYLANREDCNACPLNATCIKEFDFSPAIHETLLNPIPLHTYINRKLRKKIRPLCEAGNFKDKHIYNNNAVFKNNDNIVSFMNSITDIAQLLDMIVFVKCNKNKKPRTIDNSRQLKLNIAA